VSVAQHPLTSVSDDVAAVKRVLAMQDGPAILVGHSYGGAIITAAGNDAHVVGLVYIAAHALDEGETEAANGKRFPNATKAIRKTDDGFTYLDPAFYHADFAADLPERQRSSRRTRRVSRRPRFSPRRPPNPHGKPSRAGMPLPRRIASSIPISNACTPSVPAAT
jgi:pimeloyl-ACP methyl ester carboxylesterase